ncbi:MAG: hypothetical protein ABMA13_17610 [Chthoniobacteraceae bacterium]
MVKLLSTVRKRESVLLAMAILGILSAHTAKAADDVTQVDGQVFIVTKGAGSYKLALVTIGVFDDVVLSENLQRKRTEALPAMTYFTEKAQIAKALVDEAKKVEDAAFKVYLDEIRNQKKKDQYEAAKTAASTARELWRTILGRAGYGTSAQYYFSDLPPPLMTTKTDADGKFSFKVARNAKYILAAQAERTAGNAKEEYAWMVRVDASGQEAKMIFLSNDNLSTADSAQSAIHTVGAESLVRSAMEGQNLTALLAIIERNKREDAAKAEREEMERHAKELAKYRSDPKLAQRRAIELFPELRIAESPLNKEFLSRYKRYQTEKPEFLSDPDWPIRLAKECAAELQLPSARQ